MARIPIVTCFGCEREMVPAKNGVDVEMTSGGNAYAKVSGDLYECQGCGAQVVTRFASEPLAEAWQPGYEAIPVKAQVALR